MLKSIVRFFTDGRAFLVNADPPTPKPPETMQELFDASLAHIRKQGGPSAVIVTTTKGMPGVSCRYRGPNGRSCATAPFLTGYVPEMEGQSWLTIATLYRSRAIPGAVELSLFVGDLQFAHDQAAETVVNGHEAEPIIVVNDDANFMAEYEEQMRRLALNCGLKYTPPEG